MSVLFFWANCYRGTGAEDEERMGRGGWGRGSFACRSKRGRRGEGDG